MGSGLALALLAELAVWAGLSNLSWWTRYSTLVGFTLVVAWLLSRFQWVEGGYEFPLLQGSVFAIVGTSIAGVIVYTAWLYRGAFAACAK
ncbi:hypothetical protein Enr13x_48650 [Stieleria neptunia]|uniref:Uncharacterized protein n=1 Tax=Stieleria neptunia TaxID=2527979 RepID=A0A518HVW1_9BACT|nr:hypothetical protein Enr13x_48650 [Stieleria neptunia]